MRKSDKKLAPVLAEETELNADELDNISGGHTGGVNHPGRVNQVALGTNSNPKLCDGSVRPADGSVRFLISL